MIRFNVSPWRRMFMFLCAAALCMIIGALVVALVAGDGHSAPRLRIAMIIQDVVMFVLPPIATAMVVCRQPAALLCIDRKPDWRVIGMVIVTLGAMIPAMNAVIQWNQNLHLPESMAPIEQMLRAMEENASAMVDNLIQGGSVGQLVVAVLIIAVMAGFSEELFFRGGIQRLLTTANVNKHVAVWATAILFSAIHFQFFGFVPRLLLGALFGYLLVWTGNLWVPITAHVVNNAVATVALWWGMRTGESAEIDTIGADNPALIILSVVLTAACLRVIYRLTTGKR